jgi:hypothetical protein
MVVKYMRRKVAESRHFFRHHLQNVIGISERANAVFSLALPISVCQDAHGHY